MSCYQGPFILSWITFTSGAEVCYCSD
jgi:hypothetical protein